MIRTMNSNRTLVFTVALNGYAMLYRNHLLAQRRWAERHGYQYHAITGPSWKYSASEAAWLKIAVICDALKGGFERVIFLDSDAEPLENAPGLEAIDMKGGSVCLAHGESGRYNSGVIYAKNDAASREFFEMLLSNISSPISSADDVGWGENGHVISLAKNNSTVQEMNRAWNNTWLPAPDPEYIRHHTGSLATAGTLNWRDRVLRRGIRTLANTLISDRNQLQRVQILAQEYRPGLPTLQ